MSNTLAVGLKLEIIKNTPDFHGGNYGVFCHHQHHQLDYHYQRVQNTEDRS